jgi:hypothetical protein
MKKNKGRWIEQVLLEVLESRTFLSSTPFATVNLPGAGTAWDYSTGNTVASPVFTNVLNDGHEDILTVNADKHTLTLWGYNSANAGSPEVLKTYDIGAQSQIQSTPIAINTPAGPQIFVGTASNQLIGFNAITEAILPGFPVTIPDPKQATNFHKVLGQLAAADLEGTGTPDIVVTSLNNEVTAVRDNGSIYWQFNNDDTIFSGVAIGDINRDGKLDVVVGGDSSASGTYDAGGRITVLTADGRREWVQDTDQTIWSSPVLVDLQGNGYLDVVVGSGYGYGADGNGNYPGNKVYAFDQNGNVLPGWPYVTEASTVDGRVYSSPAVADLTGNGQYDIVVVDAQDKLHVIQPNGTALYTVADAMGTPRAGGQLYTSPIIADINGDGTPDIVIPGTGFVRGFNGATGAQTFNYTDNLLYANSAAVGAFEGNSSWQMAIVGNELLSSTSQSGPSVLKIFDLGTSTLVPPQPQSRLDGTLSAQQFGYTGDPVFRSDAFSTPLVTTLYTVALGRNPTAGELQTYWIPQFRAAAGIFPLIDGIEGSTEARTDLIQKWYEQFLHRPAENTASGLQYWINAIAGGQSYATTSADISASDEAYNLAGGTDKAWVDYLYTTALGRPADTGPSGDQYWIAQLSNTNRGATAQARRQSVAHDIAESTEGTTDLINGYYTSYRPGGLTTPPVDSFAEMFNDLHANVPEEKVLANMLTANGDYVGTQADGTWIRALYQDVLNRPITPAETASRLNSLAAGTTRAQIAQSVVTSNEARTVTIDSWFNTYLGRAPTSTELQTDLNTLASGGSYASIQVGIISSAEFYQHAGGTNTTFIQAAYLDLLGRAASQSDISSHVGDSNVRTDLPQSLVTSTEFQQYEIDSLYFHYLRRFSETLPDQGRVVPAGTAFGGTSQLNILKGGGTVENVIQSLVLSAEYDDLALNKGLWTGDRWKDAVHV